MKCLLVIAHPVSDSLCHTMARSAIAALTAGGPIARVPLSSDEEEPMTADVTAALRAELATLAPELRARLDAG